MDTTTLIVILLVILLIGGGGFYGRGRWYKRLSGKKLNLMNHL